MKTSTKNQYTNRQERISWWKQDLLENAKILVIGAGATGNEVLKNLALLGVGNIMICDMDTIDESNLSRTVLFSKNDIGRKKAEVAAERLKKLTVAENFNVDYFSDDIVYNLGDGVFGYFDAVLGCLDNLLARVSMAKRCNIFGKPLIDSGIGKLSSNLSVHKYPESSCLACNIPEWLMFRERDKRNSCTNVIRRLRTEGKAATTLVSAAFIGALQVQETVKSLHGNILEYPIEYGVSYNFEGMTNNYTKTKIPINNQCTCHLHYKNIQKSKLSNLDRLKDCLEYCTNYCKEYIFLDTMGEREFTPYGECRLCHKRIDVFEPTQNVYEEDLLCNNCRSKTLLKPTNPSIDRIVEFSLKETSDRILNMSLEEIGIPPLHIITIRSYESENVWYFELTTDIKRVFKSIKI